MPANDRALLVLEATGPEAERLAGGRRKEFAGRGTIGRAEDNDWVLPHPLVSGRHAIIDFANGVFYITDHSTNGIFVTSRKNRLTKGQPSPIADGDVIIIEPFRIQASVAGVAPVADLLIPAEPAPLEPPPPLRASPPQPAWDAADPFSSGDQFGRGDQFGVQAPLAGDQPLVDSAQPDDLDPLKALFGEAEPVRPGPPPPRAQDLEAASPLNDVLPPIRVGPTQPPPPRPQAPLIPDDYDIVADRGGSGPLPQVGREQAPPPPPPRVEPPAPPRPPVEERPLRPQVTRPPVPPQRPPEAADQGAGILAAVLAGAGLHNAPVTPQLARNLGEILRVVVAGVMEALQARQEVKGEFRMQGTIVRQVGNNALKFSANVDDALHNLLVKQNAAYLGPVDAFQDAFRDLRNHEIAMLAGMRAAFEAVLADFSPERLQSQFDRNVKKGILGAKPEYWEMYRQRLEDLARDPETTFRNLFSDRFVRAYQEQLDRLNEQGRARKP